MALFDFGSVSFVPKKSPNREIDFVQKIDEPKSITTTGKSPPASPGLQPLIIEAGSITQTDRGGRLAW